MRSLITAVICMMCIEHAVAWPRLWDSCTEHPAEPLARHKAPVEDEDMKIVLMDSDVEVDSWCPGVEYTVQVTFDDGRHAMITADAGVFDLTGDASAMKGAEAHGDDDGESHEGDDDGDDDGEGNEDESHEGDDDGDDDGEEGDDDEGHSGNPDEKCTPQSRYTFPVKASELEATWRFDCSSTSESDAVTIKVTSSPSGSGAYMWKEVTIKKSSECKPCA